MVGSVRAFHCGIRAAWTQITDAGPAVADLAVALGTSDLSLLICCFSSDYDAASLASALSVRFPGVPVIGCTTSSAIAPAGSMEQGLVLMSLPAKGFRIATTVLRDIRRLDVQGFAAAVRGLRREFDQRHGSRKGTRFALTLIDGLANVEETVVSTIAWALDGIPLVGGSAGDDLSFSEIALLHRGETINDGAIIAIIETDFSVELFTTDNFEPTPTKFVVTATNEDERRVFEFNAEPAAQEYATALGIESCSLSPLDFASHPLVVKVGGEYYSRSIRALHDDGSLSFYCAVSEGVVLTLAQPRDVVAATREELARLDQALGGIDVLIGFDCVLRRLDAEARQVKRDLAELYRQFNVIGFETFGEQFGAMHLNQTFTGIAIGRGLAAPQ